MSAMKTMQLRLAQDVIDRAEALVPVMAEAPEVASFGTVTRASVLRMALMRGLAALEEEHPPGRSRRRR